MKQYGTCCRCGYKDEEETLCPKHKSNTHCVHWWDGDGTECKHGSPSCKSCKEKGITNV